MTKPLQTYEDYIKLNSIFELEPPPTAEEINSLEGTEANQHLALCELLFWRGHTDRTPLAKDLLRASNHFLTLLPSNLQKEIKSMQFQALIHYLDSITSEKQ